MSRGGKRTGAGRPAGGGAYGEATRPVRIPLSQVDRVLRFVREKEYALPLYAAGVSAGFPSPADDYVEAFVKDVNRAKVLRAKTVMVKPDQFDTSKIKLSEAFKVNEASYIEDFLPKVLAERPIIVVVDNKGDTKGYITEKELAISLSKTGYNESAKIN